MIFILKYNIMLYNNLIINDMIILVKLSFSVIYVVFLYKGKLVIIKF